MLLVEARLKDEIIENKEYFSEYDKCLILNNQIIAMINHVPFSIKAFLFLDTRSIKPDMFKFFQPLSVLNGAS